MIDVVAIGNTNAGKSATLSALANCRNLFPSRDVPRATRSICAFEVNNLRRIDTPGLDANETDTKMALLTAARAQRVLFCHSARMVDPRPTELRALTLYGRDPGVVWKTYFVLTHADDVPSRAALLVVAERVAEPLRSTFGVPFLSPDAPFAEVAPGEPIPRRILLVANQRYWVGSRCQGRARHRLLALSGIPQRLRLLEVTATLDPSSRNPGGGSVRRLTSSSTNCTSR